MKSIPLTRLTLEVARRIIWFEPPEQALSEPIRFMAYAMTYARHEDMQVIRRYVCDDDFRTALDQAPRESLTQGHGLIGTRSWVGIRPRRVPSGGLLGRREHLMPAKEATRRNLIWKSNGVWPGKAGRRSEKRAG